MAGNKTYTPIKGQKLWWSSIEFGSSLSSGVIDTYIIAFYLFDVLGFYTGEEAIIRSAFIGTIMFVGKIVQGLANLPVAQISDKIQTRLGRRRIFVLIGFLPWGLSLYMLFGFPATNTSIFAIDSFSAFTLGLMWLAIWYLVYNITNAVVINPYLAMLPEIAQTSLERTSYQQYRGIFTFMGMVLGAIVWPIVGPITGAPLVASVMIISALIMVIGSKEDPNISPVRVSFSKSVKTVLENNAFKSYIVTIMGWMAASGMLLASLPIVVEGMFGINLNESNVVSWIGLDSGLVMSIVSGSFVITALITIFFVSMIQRKLGKKKAFQLALFTFAIFTSTIIFVGLIPGSTFGTDSYYQLMFLQLMISILITGIPAGAIIVLLYSVFSDVIDNDPLGERRESMYFAVQGVLDWGAASLGTLLMGVILAIFGSSDYNSLDKGILETGSLGIRVVVLAAAIIMLTSTWLFRNYPLEVD